MSDNIFSQQKTASQLSAILMEHAGIAMIHWMGKEILLNHKSVSDEDIRRISQSFNDSLNTGLGFLQQTFEQNLLAQCTALEKRADSQRKECGMLESRCMKAADMIALQQISERTESGTGEGI